MDECLPVKTHIDSLQGPMTKKNRIELWMTYLPALRAETIKIPNV
jgi:hypothetical protein